MTEIGEHERATPNVDLANDNHSSAKRDTRPPQDEVESVRGKVGPSNVADLKAMLAGKLEELCRSYGLNRGGKSMIMSAATILSTLPCEREIQFRLRNHFSEAETRFDSFYREKSEYATLKILDHLKKRLAEEGVEASLETESRDDFGIYDVTLSRGGEKKLRLEVKASMGLPLEQLERYLWEHSPLVLIRVITGQVTFLRPSELEEFVRFSISLLIDKSERLLCSKPVVVPGRYCRSCLDLECPHNRNLGRRSGGFVMMSDSEFGLDLSSFLRHLPRVAERTSSLVIQEFQREIGEKA